MLVREQVHLGEFLKAVAEELDIPDSRHEEAVNRYEAVSKWLSAPDSPLQRFGPDLYPQGSFRLGTVVKPVSDEDEYDIDLVCRLEIRKDTVGQQQLKQMVGERLKQHGTYVTMLDEKQRCWRLNYANEFHMDILPAIPCPLTLDETILVPDAKLDAGDWHISSPKGYATWFRKRMEVVFQRRRKALAESIRASIEDVPEWKVKTPLQRAVQILKRHRDIMFQDDADDKPVSIIITTLAAHAYQNEDDLYESIIRIVDGMPLHIQWRNGVPWVPNPVNNQENFADKWREHPQRATKFANWLKQVKIDLQSAFSRADHSEMAGDLVPFLGGGPVGRAQRRLGIPIRTTASGTGAITLRPRTFFAVPHRSSPAWRVSLVDAVVISASVHKKERGVRIQDIANGRQKPLPKKLDLRFKASTTARMPYDVYWQVVNTGPEATAENDLRGRFFKGEKTHWEGTRYTGSHWVECFIVKDDVCIARSGEFVISIA